MKTYAVIMWFAVILLLGMQPLLVAAGSKTTKAASTKPKAAPKQKPQSKPAATVPEITLMLAMKVDGSYELKSEEKDDTSSFKEEYKDEIKLLINGTMRKRLNDPEGFFTGDQVFGTYGLGAVPRKEWLRVEGTGKASRTFQSSQPLICNFVDGPTISERHEEDAKAQITVQGLSDSPTLHFDIPSRRYTLMLPPLWWRDADVKIKGQNKTIQTACERTEKTEEWESREALAMAGQAVGEFGGTTPGLLIQGSFQVDKNGGFSVSGTRAFQLHPPDQKESRTGGQRIEKKRAELTVDYKISFTR
jgi:hypothetical protein